MSERPADVQYTKTHEWVRIEGDTATIGITDFAVEHLGDLVFVDLPDEGADIEAGESVAEVESVKAVGEINAPVSGSVSAVNGGLADDMTPLSQDCYGAGWLFKVALSEPPEGLMDLAAYEAQLASEGDPS
jgi:glycine cleavage system H protein